jgi:hypothetical protein
MTRKKLEEIYDNGFAQAGDSETDFYEWAIDYLLDLLKKEKR